MASVASTGRDSGQMSWRNTVHSVPPSISIALISSRGMSRTKLTMISTDTGIDAAVSTRISAYIVSYRCILTIMMYSGTTIAWTGIARPNSTTENETPTHRELRRTTRKAIPRDSTIDSATQTTVRTTELT